jgi:hypothetical protein
VIDIRMQYSLAYSFTVYLPSFVINIVMLGISLMISEYEALKGPSCNQRKLANEIVNGEIYGGSS